MARKDSKTPKKRTPSKIKIFFSDERTHIALGIVLFLLTLYMLLALLSFLFTGAADQSIVLAPNGEREEMKRQITNWTGLRGAIIAERIINDGFGIAVYAMFIFPFVLSMRLIGVRIASLWKTFLFPLIFTLWFAFFAEFCFGSLLADSS